MRNLKRALSLALASVMLLGMMVVGTSAVSYTDVDENDNVEAIEVASAIGLMNGVAEGKFDPEGTITREQLAGIMCTLEGLNPADYAGEAAAKFSDVKAGDWSESYIAAVVANGIMVGKGDGTFDRSSEVMAYEIGLTIAKTLGYFQYSADYGDDWDAAIMNATRVARDAGLFDGIGTTNVMVPLTRNQIAQVCLNALKADVVDTDGSGLTVSGNGFTVSTGANKYEPITSNESKYGAIANEKSGANPASVYTVQLGERLFDGKLELTTDDDNEADAFGRPGSTWEYDGKEIAAANEPTFVFTEEVKQEDMDKALKGYKDETALAVTDVLTDGTKAASFTYSASAVKGLTKDGVRVEVYADGKEITKIVVINEYLMKITKIDTKGEKVTLERKAGTAATSGFTSVTKDKNEDIYAQLAAKAEDDYVLVTVANTKAGHDSDSPTYEIQTVADVKTVTGDVSKVKTDESLTIGGTEYTMAENADSSIKNAKVTSDSDTVFYLSSSGCLMFSEESGSTDTADVILVVATYQEKDKYETTKDYIQGVLTDGTIVEAEYNTSDGGGADVASTVKSKPTAYTYEIKDGKYVLKAGTATKDSAVAGVAVTGEGGASASVNTDSKKLTIGSVWDNYFASDVKFIYVDGVKDKLKVTVKDGVQKVATGKLTDDQDWVVISIDGDGNPVVSALFITKNPTPAGRTDTLIYAPSDVSKSGTSAGKDGKALYDYEVYVDGVKTTIQKSKDEQISKGFYTYTVDEKTGAYTLESCKDNCATEQVIKGVTLHNGEYFLDVTSGTAFADYVANDATVVDVRSDKAVWEISSISDLRAALETTSGFTRTDLKVAVVYDSDAETIITVYVTAGTAQGD